MKRSWYRFAAAAAPDVADLYIYGLIGRSLFADDDDAVSAKQFLDELSALPKSVRTIRLHLNSPGGDPFDAVAIANALRSHPAHVLVSIDALAASAASVVAMAGDIVTIAENGVFMIHDARALAFGTGAELRAMADGLDRIDTALITTYRWHSKLSEEEIKELMSATTWMSPSEALEHGFVTEIVAAPDAVEAVLPRASVRALGEIPAPYRARIAAWTAPQSAPAPTPTVDVADVTAVLEATERAGVPFLARPLIAAKVSPAQLKERVAAAGEIRALCRVAKLPELAEMLIRDNVSKATVRAILTTFTAKLDCVEIDAHLPPDERRSAQAGLSVKKVYAERNAAK